MPSDEDSGDRTVRVRTGRVDSLSLYEVTDDELEVLEHGGPSSFFLNFAVLLISTASSFLITLLTTTVLSDRTFTVFLLITLVGFVGGAILLLIWNRNRQSASSVVKRIKGRMPQEPAEDKDAEEPDAVNKQ